MSLRIFNFVELWDWLRLLTCLAQFSVLVWQVSGLLYIEYNVRCLWWEYCGDGNRCWGTPAGIKPIYLAGLLRDVKEMRRWRWSLPYCCCCGDKIMLQLNSSASCSFTSHFAFSNFMQKSILSQNVAGPSMFPLRNKSSVFACLHLLAENFLVSNFTSPADLFHSSPYPYFNLLHISYIYLFKLPWHDVAFLCWKCH